MRITPTLDPAPLLHKKAAKALAAVKAPAVAAPAQPKPVDEDARSIDSFEAAGYMSMLDLGGENILRDCSDHLINDPTKT